MAGDGIRVEFDQKDFARMVKSFPPALQKSLRKRLRGVGKVITDDMKRVVGSGDMRSQIGSGIRTLIRTGKTVQGVLIESTGRGLSSGRRGMHRTWNKPTFRHPVFGNRDAWVSQSGNPYFGSTIARHADEARAAVVEALDEAVKESSA